jgi:RNA polymerase sigma-70 factor, ECF subfamily
MLRTDSTSRSIPGHENPAMPRSAAGAVVPDFTEIYRLYFEFVWGCSRRLGVGELEIDDVVQEVFIVIHGRLSTLERPESLRSWIYGIVRRTVSTYRRARRAKNASASALLAEPSVQCPERSSPQDLAEQSDQVKLLWTLLEKLDPPRREVFVLAELDEMSVPEIASALDVPVNTVYSRLRVARRELEEALCRFHAQTSQRGRTCPT